MSRREYPTNIKVNGVGIVKVIIDPHFEERHSETVSDEIILGLVKTLDGETFEPEEIDPPYKYFVVDRISYNGKKYKLVWLIEENQFYIGVVNAYRR